MQARRRMFLDQVAELAGFAFAGALSNRTFRLGSAREIALSVIIAKAAARHGSAPYAAFRRLVEHLRERSDVQNIDLMNLAGFCRNCLSKWYRAAAEERGVALSDPDAREIVYGMPYKEWQARFQREAAPEQQAKFAAGAASREH